MRNIFLSAIISIFFLGLFIYMATTVVNPLLESRVDELVALNNFTSEEDIYNQIGDLVDRGVILDYVSPNRLFLVIVTLLLSIMSAFVTVHLSIDKLFFKEFYLPPNLFLASRRGFFLALSIGVFIILRFIGMPVWQSGTGFLFVVLIEVLITTFVSSRKASKAIENNEEEDLDIFEDENMISIEDY